MRRKDENYENEVVLKFDKRDVESMIARDLKLPKRMSKSFDFIYDKLVKFGKFIDLTGKTEIDFEDVKKDEGKNYDWFAVKYDEIYLIIRCYHAHFTIFIRSIEPDEFMVKINPDAVRKSYGAFTLYTNTENMSDEESDSRVDYPFQDINKCIFNLFPLIKEDNFHSLWNDLSFQRPEFCEVKQAFYQRGGWGSDVDIYSIDLMIYCAEELSNEHTTHFAQNEMVEKVKTIKVGDKISSYLVEEVRTDLGDSDEPYYHGVGLCLKNTNFEDSKASWSDVYSLTQFYFDYMFPREEEKREEKM